MVECKRAIALDIIVPAVVEAVVRCYEHLVLSEISSVFRSSSHGMHMLTATRELDSRQLLLVVLLKGRGSRLEEIGLRDGKSFDICGWLSQCS